MVVFSAGSYVMPEAGGLVTLPCLNYPQSLSKSYFGGGLLQGYGWEGLEAVRSWCSAVSIAASWKPREVEIANCCARYVVQLVPTLNGGTRVRSAVKFIQWVCNWGFFGVLSAPPVPFPAP